MDFERSKISDKKVKMEFDASLQTKQKKKEKLITKIKYIVDNQ